MKATCIFILFFIPLLSFAQLKNFEIIKKERMPIMIFSDVELNDALIVFIYAPGFEGIKFKATQGWINGKEPKYDNEKFRWVLYLPINVRNEIRINFKGFNEGTIKIPASPKDQFTYELYEKIKDLKASPKLTIKSDPPDAKLTIKTLSDGRVLVDEILDRGTFFTDKLRAGMVKISVEKELFKPVDSLLELKNGEAFSIEFKLESVAKFVQISTDPSDAALFLNSKKVDNPFSGTLNYGVYSLTLKRDNFQDLTTSFNLTGESNSVLNYTMRKKFSEISFDPSVVKKAEIKIDNELFPVLNSGVGQNQIPHGRYNLQVTKNKFKFYNMEIIINKDKQFIPVELIPIKPDRKTGKLMTVALGLGGIGTGVYLMQSANKNYEAYKNATSPAEAGSLRKQVESADRIYPIALGLGGLFLGIRIFL